MDDIAVGLHDPLGPSGRAGSKNEDRQLPSGQFELPVPAPDRWRMSSKRTTRLIFPAISAASLRFAVSVTSASASASARICLSRAGGSVAFSTTTIPPALRTASIAAMSGASCRISNATRSPAALPRGNQCVGEPVGGGVQFCVIRLPFARADGRARRMLGDDLREAFRNGLFRRCPNFHRPRFH